MSASKQENDSAVQTDLLFTMLIERENHNAQAMETVHFGQTIGATVERKLHQDVVLTETLMNTTV